MTPLPFDSCHRRFPVPATPLSEPQPYHLKHSRGGISRPSVILLQQAGEGAVYDNKLGGSDTGYDGTEIGGGNIKVHRP